jgi:outer membrane protein assembly factor BamD (BamD/ComL family)
MDGRVVLTAILTISSLLLLPAPEARGQEEYRLAEDDTWEATEIPDPATPEGQLAVAREALVRGDDERAEFLATQWIERHDRHPLLAEAYLIRGDALMARRSYYEALFDYEYIARTFVGSEAFVTALERELEIAKLFAGGTRRKLWGMRIVDATEEAEELLIRIQERLPGSRLAEDAGMTLGDFYFARRKMELAAEMYSIFIENYPDSEQIDKARKRLIFSHLASFKGPEFDASGLYEARTRLREMKVVAPAAAQRLGADALLSGIDETDARKMLVTARWYLKRRDYIAAELMIRRLLRRYPRSVAAADGVRLAESILPRLPKSVLDEAPDYPTLRATLTAGAADTQVGAKTPASERDPATPEGPSDE